MRQIFVILAITLPLVLAFVFIINNVVSGTFPLFRSTPIDESDYLNQTYEAGLDYCKNNYRDIETIEKNEEYRNCIDSVETWHAVNLKK